MLPMLALLAQAAAALAATHTSAPFTIAYAPDHAAAAHELQRYLYLLLGPTPAAGDDDDRRRDEPPTRLPVLLELASNGALVAPSADHESRKALFLLAGPLTADSLAHDFLRQSPDLEGWQPLPDDAGEHDHIVHTSRDGRLAVCHGATALATKYAVFSLLESLGVGFRLHGDALPAPRPAAALITALAQHGRAAWSPGVVNRRGIQPFHDFAEGPDQWNADEYKLHIDQLTKLKMNFIGFHTCARSPFALARSEVW